MNSLSKTFVSFLIIAELMKLNIYFKTIKK